MTGRLPHLWPEGIAGRLGLLVLAGLGVLGLVGGGCSYWTSGATAWPNISPAPCRCG